MERQTILNALEAFAASRPGIDPRNYGGGLDGWRAYRAESRSVTRDLKHARILLRAVERSTITAEALAAAFRDAYAGRLTLTYSEPVFRVWYDEDTKYDGSRGDRHMSSKQFTLREQAEHYASGVAPGRFASVEQEKEGAARLEYCTGQYYPTEYRRAVCAVLASALWHHYREDMAAAARLGESAGDAVRRGMRRIVPAHVARIWFN